MREERRQPTAATPTDSLARLETKVKIATSIIIPIVIALAGWWVQSSVTEASIKKDYVGMAMGILKDGKTADPALVTWAAEVVRKNSPTPLSNELRTKIIEASLASTHAMLQLKAPPPPKWMMEQPEPVPDFPLADSKTVTMTEQQVAIRWLNDNSAAKQNAIKIKALQAYINNLLQAEQQLRNDLLQQDQKRLLEGSTESK